MAGVIAKALGPNVAMVINIGLIISVLGALLVWIMLAAIFLTSTVIGYRLFAGIIPHLRGANPEYIDPKKIIQLLLGEIRKNAKLPGGEAVAS